MHGAVIIEGHIQGLANARALGRLGIPVVIINDRKACIARYSKYCKRFFVCPSYDSLVLATFLKNLAEKEGLKGWMLFPSNDHAVVTISHHRALLEKFYTMLVPDKLMLAKIYDKVSLMALAEACGVHTPLTLTPEIALSSLPGFPCLVKGRYGLSFYRKTGRKAFLCDNETELRKVLSFKFIIDNPELAMVQDVIPSEKFNYTISAATFCVDGEIKSVWMGEKLREHPVRFGTATFTNSVYVEELLQYTRMLMQELKYTGISETEFLFDPRDRRYKLIEINPRTWLWVGHAAACGVDFTAMAWHYANGLPVTYPIHYKIGVKWRNFYTDLYFGVGAVLRGKIGSERWFKYLFCRKIPAVWDISDPGPFIMLTLMLPSLARNR